MERRAHSINPFTGFRSSMQHHLAAQDLDERTECVAIRFMNRDVDVVKCLSTCVCDKRQSCDGMQICRCPIQRRRCGLA